MAMTTSSRSKDKLKAGDIESIKKTAESPMLKITKDVTNEIEILAQKGLSRRNIQDYFGISDFKWNKKNLKETGLERAYLRGKSKGISFTAGKLMQLINSGNFEAIKFYLARIAKYTENVNSDNEDFEEKDFSNLTINTIDPIEAAKIYQQIMKGSSKK